MTNDDRGRGVLTAADREYLRGEKDHISETAQFNARRRIRGRIENALLDFPLLLERLSDRDHERVFSPEEENYEDLRDAVKALHAFLYGGLTGQQDLRLYTELVEVGIEMGERRYFGRESRAELEVDPLRRPEDPDRLRELLNEGKYGELTDRDRQWVVMKAVKYGVLDGDSIEEAFWNSPDGRRLEEVSEEIRAAENDGADEDS